MRRFIFIVCFIAVCVLARTCFYTVDASEYAYVTVLGRHVATFDGGGEGAGLHVGLPWPFQAVQRLDRRLQQLDLPGRELLTTDAEGKTVDKTLTVEAFACWKIADGDAVDRFVRRLGTPEQAQGVLAPLISSQLGSAISQMRMDDLVSVSPGSQLGSSRVDDTMDGLQKKLLGGLQVRVRDEYGIDLIDVRLRRFNYQAEVRQSIFERIRSERRKIVTDYRSQGELQAKNIESAADEKVRTLLAEARAKEEEYKGQADGDAMRIRNEANKQDPEFYGFLKQMEKLQSILGDNRTVLLLSTHHPMFDLMFQPPKLEK